MAKRKRELLVYAFAVLISMFAYVLVMVVPFAPRLLLNPGVLLGLCIEKTIVIHFGGVVGVLSGSRKAMIAVAVAVAFFGLSEQWRETAGETNAMLAAAVTAVTVFLIFLASSWLVRRIWGPDPVSPKG